MKIKKVPAVKPSPLPWKQDAGLISDANGVEVADLDYPEGGERAALIVRAVNAHAPLFRLLEKTERANSIQHSGGELQAEDWSELYQIAQECRAALHAAGERI